MSKHTPGPWETRRSPAWSKDVDIGKIGVFQNLAFVSSLNEDDARLIAAAPELLEALRGELSAERSDCNDRKCGACSRCRSYAAIAKAEGA